MRHAPEAPRPRTSNWQPHRHGENAPVAVSAEAKAIVHENKDNFTAAGNTLEEGIQRFAARALCLRACARRLLLPCVLLALSARPVISAAPRPAAGVRSQSRCWRSSMSSSSGACSAPWKRWGRRSNGRVAQVLPRPHPMRLGLEQQSALPCVTPWPPRAGPQRRRKKNGSRSRASARKARALLTGRCEVSALPARCLRRCLGVSIQSLFVVAS